MTRFLYGGNAFLYHISLAEYEELLDWLSDASDDLWMIPSAGPSFGRLMDQAQILKRYKFPCVMALPCGDPRDAAGLERGLREFAQKSGMPLVLYLKEESNFGGDKMAGLDAVARMVADGTCVWIKYAVVRSEPQEDPYLQAVLDRIDRNRRCQRNRRTAGNRPHEGLVLTRVHHRLGVRCSGCRVWSCSTRASRGHFDTCREFPSAISCRLKIFGINGGRPEYSMRRPN